MGLLDDIVAAAERGGNVINDIRGATKRVAAERARELLAKFEPVVTEMIGLTEDTDEASVLARALGVYAGVVRHAAAGGVTQLVAKDGTTKTLRVRLKKA